MRRPGLRIGVVAALVACALAIGIGLLVQRALASLARERVAAHAVVAERVFDEIERELTELIEPEEERPFAEYRALYVPDNQAPGGAALSCSALADPPSEAWLVGHFQIDPGGAFTSPLSARLPNVDANGNGVDDRLAELERLSRPLRDDRSPQIGAVSAAQVEQVLDIQEAYQQAEGDDSGQKKLLSSLNRGSSSRIARQTKGGTVSSSGYEVFNDAGLSNSQAPARPQQRAVDAPLSVAITPMQGRLVDDERFVLHRAVRVGRDEYRQGLALRLPELAQALERRVLTDPELADQVAIAWRRADAPAEPARDGFAYAFHHRFAPPFGDLAGTAFVRDSPVVTGGETGLVWALALAVVAVVAVGGAAIARAATAAVGFAQRRNDFVSAVTHELKTPLTAIRLYGEMLRDGMVADDAARQKYYGTIAAESERLSRLIANVLELARLEKGDRPMAWHVGSPAEVLAEAAQVCAPHARGAGFAIEVRADPGLPAVRYDRDALTQVVINLVDNALKFARAADERTVVLEAFAADGGVRIRVADRGPGVPDAHLARIFQPFFRGERELTRTTTGTGIGLSLVKGLIERMGGAVSACNRAGGGFEVTVSLPAAA
ncbi:MAG TPA: HAMP domain-containing sensor histidine kinase [Planctomycetota bacterium]|nr:HAMP domain-containing sensor histidine kinase [Planctomycetota bacterium]